jgi:hypothetical protein
VILTLWRIYLFVLGLYVKRESNMGIEFTANKKGLVNTKPLSILSE